MSKRSWIFLRGLVRGRGHWGEFPELFRQAFPDDEVELLDIPGNGERNQETSPWSLAEYVPLMRSQSKFIQQGRRVHVLAVSLGAMVAVEWMRQFPNDFEKMYLAVTSSQWSPFYQRFQPRNYATLLKAVASTSPERIEEIILSSIVNSQDRLNAVKPGMVAYTTRHPVRRENLVRQLRAASQADFPDRPSVAVKLIGTWGDRLVSPQCIQAIGKAWGLEPEMHPWSGHDIPIDDPIWLIERLRS